MYSLTCKSFEVYFKKKRIGIQPVKNAYYFIINPASNRGNNGVEKKIVAFFKNRDEKFKIALWADGIKVEELVIASKEDGYNTVVACGGDGTIMEVGRSLMNSTQTLGIISLGSGNGIARHFGIPTSINKALKILVKNKTQKMDVGQVNDHLFFGNIGLGIEANFIKHYQRERIHGIKGYFMAAIKALRTYKYPNLSYTIDGETKNVHPLVFMLSNTNEQGYGFSLTPSAKTDDGMLNLSIVGRQTSWRIFTFSIEMLLFKRPLRKKMIVNQLVNEIKITSPFPVQFELDGEYFSLSKKEAHIRVLTKAIDIVTP